MEEYLRQRDDNVFSKFNDDLNTLLVFVSLLQTYHSNRRI